VVLCYSRDEIADPLRALGGIIKVARDVLYFIVQIGWAFCNAPELARQCRDVHVAADSDVAYEDVMRKPNPCEGDVATPHDVSEDDPVLDGACGVCDETMVHALGLCFRCAASRRAVPGRARVR
jgi:hypothetical protein